MSTHCAALTLLLGSMVLALLSSCNAIYNDTDKAHDLIVGSRVWGDRLLERAHVQKSYSWLRIVKDMRTFAGDGVSKITYIQVLDQQRDGNGGYASIINGGTDNNFVTLKFKSQRNQNIHFIVEIYGKR